MRHQEVAPAAETATGEVECQSSLLGCFAVKACGDGEVAVSGLEGGDHFLGEGFSFVGAEGLELPGKGGGPIGEAEGAGGAGLDGAVLGDHPGYLGAST